MKETPQKGFHCWINFFSRPESKARPMFSKVKITQKYYPQTGPPQSLEWRARLHIRKSRAFFLKDSTP